MLIDFDSVPDEEIALYMRTLEEGREWLNYSIFVLQERGRQLEHESAKLMGNPFTYRKWKKSIKLWEANTARMDAISDAHDLMLRTIKL